jgi:hypothetical protein
MTLHTIPIQPAYAGFFSSKTFKEFNMTTYETLYMRAYSLALKLNLDDVIKDLPMLSQFDLQALISFLLTKNQLGG